MAATRFIALRVISINLNREGFDPSAAVLLRKHTAYFPPSNPRNLFNYRNRAINYSNYPRGPFRVAAAATFRK